MNSYDPSFDYSAYKAKQYLRCAVHHWEYFDDSDRARPYWCCRKCGKSTNSNPTLSAQNEQPAQPVQPAFAAITIRPIEIDE